MALNDGKSISKFNDRIRALASTDLMIISQLIGPNTWFSGKMTMGDMLTFFLSNIAIDNVTNLSSTLADLQTQLNTKLSGNHTHSMSEVIGLLDALANLAPLNHTQPISSITGLQAALDSKLSSLVSTFPISQVIGLQTALNQKSNIGHTHVMGDVTGLIAALAGKLNTSLKGQPYGLAELGFDGVVPQVQLPDYIIEKISNSLFPTVGQSGKLYVNTTTLTAYRWNGASYVALGSNITYLGLGETSTTAYRGDYGKIAYDHSQSPHAPVNAQQNVQSDWNATSGDAFIKNKPILVSLTHTHDYSTITGTKPPANAQKNSDITAAEIAAALAGAISGNLAVAGDVSSQYFVSSNVGAGISTVTGGHLYLNPNGSVGSVQISTNLGQFAFNAPVYFGNYSRGGNGYTALPNGLILQWATVWADNGTKSFPVTFPNAVLGFATGTQTGNEWVSYTIVNNSQFTANATGAGNATIVAIGY